MFAAAAFHQQQQQHQLQHQHQLQQSENDYPEVCSQPVIVNSPYTPQQLALNLESINPPPSSLYPTEKTIEPHATSVYTFSPEQSYHSSSAHPLGNVNYPLATQSTPIVVYPPEKIPYVDSYLPEKPRFVDPQQEIHLPEKPQFSLISQPQPPSYPPSISSGKDIYGIPPPPPYTPQAPICGPDANVYPQQAFQISQANQTQVDELQPLVYIPPEKEIDEKKSGTAKRFLGDTLVGRFARSAVHTTTSTARLHSYLSPWGDNNSVTLPNVRYRDAALFATFSVIGGPLLEGAGDLLGGAVGDTFAATIIDPMTDFFVNNTIAKYALFQLIEQGIDKGVLEHLFPEQEKMLRTTSIRTLQCAVKHKLMDVSADIQLFDPSEAVNPTSIEKGWLCPYLYASNRTPKLSRQQDFGVAQFFGPFLKGDHQLAEKLLSECATVMGLCDPDPTHGIGSKRMLVTFVGISPYRAGMWSTSRRPGASLMHYYLLNGCPALVIPVTESAPINAWSPVTLKTITDFNFDPGPHHRMICEFLDSIINMQHILPKLQPRYEELLGRCISFVINGAIGLKNAEVPVEVLKKLDPERAGIAFFRY